MPQYSRVIIILADGARSDVIEEMAAAGDLPNISRHLIEPGVSLPAVTSFPSTTGPAYLPFLTGCFPGTCNVPGIRWLDKSLYGSSRSFDRHRSYVGLESFMMASDIAPGVRTIFEIIPDSVSIFNPIARGAKGMRNLTRLSRIWHWYYAHLTDRWAFTDSAALKKLLRVQSSAPSFTFVVFPGIDEYSHLTHPRHESVIGRYLWLDCAIGKISAQLTIDGSWEQTAVMLVADHGLSATHKHFCLNAFLEKRGLPAFFYPLILHKRGKLSANMVSGNGMSNLYFKNSDGWSRHTSRKELERISPGILEDLLEEDAIDVIAVRDEDGGVDVITKRGGAKVRLDGDRLYYEVVRSDPFGYPPLPQDLSPTSCLEHTFDKEYPDAPFQIAHLMTAPRAGDVIVSATPGFDLRVAYEKPEHFSSHGSLRSSHMRVPCISNLKLQRRPVRTVDIFPTALKILGHDIPGQIDGVPLG